MHAVNKSVMFCRRLYDQKRIFSTMLQTTAHVVFKRIWNSFSRFSPSDVLIIRPAGYTFRCEYVFYFSLFRINYWVHVCRRPGPPLSCTKTKSSSRILVGFNKTRRYWNSSEFEFPVYNRAQTFTGIVPLPSKVECFSRSPCLLKTIDKSFSR